VQQTEKAGARLLEVSNVAKDLTSIKTLVIAELVLMGTAAAANADDLPARPQGSGPLVVCADPCDSPASMRDSDPPGYDVGIIRAIARVAGSRIEYVWADTGCEVGSRGLRNSIVRIKCNLFVGLGVSRDSIAEMKEKHLAFTRPYMSQAFVLVETGSGAGKSRLSDFGDAKIGLAMSTPADAYLFDGGYKRSIFVRDRLIFKALDAGEIDVALVWSSALAYAIKDLPTARFRVVSDYVPEAGLRWNVAIAVPEGDIALKQLLDAAIADLVASGEIKRIVESYEVPFILRSADTGDVAVKYADRFPSRLWRASAGVVILAATALWSCRR